MRKILKWAAIGFGSLVVVIVLVVTGLTISVNNRLNKSHTVQPASFELPATDADLEEGERLASIYCAGCHAEDYAGTDFFNDPALAVIDAPNLTSGTGGVGSSYTDNDWIRAIRHGLDPRGRALFIMPSGDFFHLGDEDLGQIIAYLKTIPPADRIAGERSYGMLGRVLIGVGAFGDVLSAESIDHSAPRPAAPQPAISAAYGEYIVKTFGCATCHGAELSGGQDPDPAAPPGPNLTPGGNLGAWTNETFLTNVRTRTSEWMPFEGLNRMSDDELSAIFLYLQSLPALETTTR
jgi:mono/diheme cytochrome c family protein